jgi:endonuclease/exonuclease/phosphatase family metal-dependent hydrolase
MSRTLKVGSFNIQNLSINKLSDNDVLQSIIKIVSTYDIIFILELTDIESMHIICSYLEKYDYYINKKNGISPSFAEYIGVFFNKNKITRKMIKEIHINNISEYGFYRDPLILELNMDKQNIIFVINHLSPKNVDYQLGILNDLYNVLHNNNMIIMMGDYNADGSYLSNKLESSNELFTNPELKCLTTNEITNIGRNKMKYDRVFCSNECLKENILIKVDNDLSLNGYCNVDNYYTDMKITKQKAKLISDHLPIYIMLKL